MEPLFAEMERLEGLRNLYADISEETAQRIITEVFEPGMGLSKIVDAHTFNTL